MYVQNAKKEDHCHALLTLHAWWLVCNQKDEMICFRICLNLMTLQIESTHVYTQHGVAVSVHGVAQVRQVQHTCTMNSLTFLFIVRSYANSCSKFTFVAQVCTLYVVMQALVLSPHF